MYFSIFPKDPDQAVVLSFIQIQNLEREIQEKRRQMMALEQRIIESGEASISNSSLVEMQQVNLKSIHPSGHYFPLKCSFIVCGISVNLSLLRDS